MYSVTLSHHVLIAHSLAGEVFGAAQRLHGATLVIEAEFRAPVLDGDDAVCDMEKALDLVKQVCADLDYRNLDELPEFRGRNTTCEFLAGELHRRIAVRIRAGALGAAAAGGIAALRIVVRESPVAWAAFDAPL
jgi:6-pyruvoyl-tetrahydropterin synthase